MFIFKQKIFESKLMKGYYIYKVYNINVELKFIPNL